MRKSLKWMGAAYLFYIGVRLLFAHAPQAQDDLRAIARSQPAMPLPKVFFGGFLTNALNPKVAIFFLAQPSLPDATGTVGRAKVGR